MEAGNIFGRGGLRAVKCGGQGPAWSGVCGEVWCCVSERCKCHGFRNFLTDYPTTPISGGFKHTSRRHLDFHLQCYRQILNPFMEVEVVPISKRIPGPYRTRPAGARPLPPDPPGPLGRGEPPDPAARSPSLPSDTAAPILPGPSRPGPPSWLPLLVPPPGPPSWSSFLVPAPRSPLPEGVDPRAKT